MSAKTLAIKMMFRMMGIPTCEEVDRFSYDYLEGQLDPKITRQVERHLRSCKNCKRFIESYRKTRALGQRSSFIILDSEFKEKMVEFLSKKGGI